MKCQHRSQTRSSESSGAAACRASQPACSLGAPEESVLCQEAVRLMKPPLLKPPQELAVLWGPPPVSASCNQACVQVLP